MVPCAAVTRLMRRRLSMPHSLVTIRNHPRLSPRFELGLLGAHGVCAGIFGIRLLGRWYQSFIVSCAGHTNASIGKMPTISQPSLRRSGGWLYALLES